MILRYVTSLAGLAFFANPCDSLIPNIGWSALILEHCYPKIVAFMIY